jgi:hypothetical protein
MPSLTEAIEAMESAVAALAKPHLPGAVTAEQQALAALIRARENVRKLLSQSSSQSASACRKYDREFRQKLRMPERKKSDPQQQLAQRRAELEELAKREREWSQTARQSCQNPGNSSSSEPSQTNPDVASRQQPQPNPAQPSESPDAKSPGEVPTGAMARSNAAREQKSLIDQLNEIERELEKLSATSEATQHQTERATASMQKGLEALNRQDGQQAGHEGERAADQIEQLASHLAATNAKDFGKRLEQAQQSAQQLASRQSAIENKLTGQSPDLSAIANEQSDLAGRLEMLSELLGGLRRDSVAEPGNVKSILQQMEAENPSAAIAETMRQAEQNLKLQRVAQGTKNVGQASERLNELSHSLAQLRRDYATPQLKELMAVEEQLAQLMQQARRTSNGTDRTSANQQQWERLEQRLEKLAASDSRLAEALRQVREGNTNAAPESRVRPVEYQVGGPPPDGHYSWLELRDFHGPDTVAKVLQTKIQEAILAATVVDANQSIPPEYKELVERYYRALSDDLR